MKLSVIITTCNRAPALLQTLESLKKVEVPESYEVELIVVDNGSVDNTKEVVKDFVSDSVELRYVYEPRKGQSNARNRAISVAAGDIYLWTDDDVRVPCDWFEKMCLPIISGQAHGVAGSIRLAPHLHREWFTKSHYWRLADNRAGSDPPALMIGANMAFSTKVLEKVPAFDPQLGPGALGFADDTLFSRQVTEAGFEIVASDVTVEHHFDPSRILKKSWIQHGENTGKSAAYVFYHWHHRRVSLAQLKLFSKIVLLAALRIKRAVLERNYTDDTEGCDETEMSLVESIYFLSYYVKEKGKKREYSVRGLSRTK